MPKVQRCLIHFLRAISDELEIRPEDKNLTDLKDGLKSIIEKGNQLKEIDGAQQRNAGRQQLEDKLQTMAQL